jgi:hypothetical protein
MSGTVSPITFDDLRRIVAGLPSEMREDDGGRVIGAANAVIAHFLGHDWFLAHIRHDTAQPGFLRLDFSSDARREATVFRVVELAENLLNLQQIDGFEACVAQMRAGAEKIESTCAELDVGRFLYIHDVGFRFVVPQLKKGADYDLDVIYPDGLAVAADTKCKFEATAINPVSLRNSLVKARKQLPPDRPGIIFIKVPRVWIKDREVATALIEMAPSGYRGVTRSPRSPASAASRSVRSRNSPASAGTSSLREQRFAP